MSEKELHFDQIEIRRMPGIDQRFVLDSLKPGINVIVGPNGSGKTTTRRALDGVLWPNQAPDRAHVVGRFQLEGLTWRVEVDGGRAVCQREGAPHPLPELPAPDLRERYTLGLPELLADEGGAFAARIVRETAGGYDIEAAATAVGARDQASGANIGEAQALKVAQKKRRKVEEAQQALQAEEEKLAGLEAEKAAAVAAANDEETLARVIALVKAEAAYREAQVRLEALPAGLDLLSQRDEATLESLKQARQEAAQAIEEQEQQRERAVRAQAECELPEEGVPEAELNSLRGQQQELKHLEDRVASLEQEARASAAVAKAASQQLGERAQDIERHQITPAALENLATWAREAELVRVRQAFYAGYSTWLAEQFELESGDPEQWQQGRQLLTRWLEVAPQQQVSPSRLPHILLLLAALVLLVTGAGLGLSLNPLFLALSLLGLVLGGIGLWLLLTGRQVDNGEPETIQERFAALNLQPPPVWESAAVVTHLSELAQKLAAAGRYHETRALHREQEKQTQRLEAERQDLIQQIGLAPALTEELDEAVLYNLVHTLNRWQEARDAALAAHSNWQTVRNQAARLLAMIDETLARYGYEAATDAASASGQIEALAGRQQRFRDADLRLENARENLVLAQEQQQKANDNYRAFFTERALPEGDERTFYQRFERLGDYEQCREEAERARLKLEQSQDDLPDVEFSGEPVIVLCEKDLGELEVLHQEVAATADERDEIVKAIADIEAAVKQAKEGRVLEEALAEEETCVARLRQKLEEDCIQVAAQVIADHLQAITADQARPAVFHSGREKFTRITNGRYRLTMANGNNPTFRAMDLVTGLGHGLDELSSGTRIQLLLAIRLAFVERQEEVRLPLFFDETLGNSDEQRARAIIEAAVTLAQEGRQIFYFTAQLDEVAKWKQVVAEVAGELPFQVIELDRVRQLSLAEERPLEVVPVTATSVPAPDGKDYAAYGRILAVPGVDPARSGPGHLHLWHVLEDADLLYRLLRSGIRHFGQLAGLAAANQLAAFGVDEASYCRAEVRARVLAEATASWRVGRGRPVDREALEASGHVSDTFLERLPSLVRELKGDAAALITALRTRDDERAARFQDDKCDGLEEYFQAHGYLDTRATLSAEEIRQQLTIAFAEELGSGLLAPEHMEALVGRVVE